MSTPQTSNPLHGITLEMVLTRLVEHYGWEKLENLYLHTRLRKEIL